MEKLELLKGASVVLENAKELIEESELLFRHDRKERAFTLSQLAIEEIGKASMLMGQYSLYDTKDSIPEDKFNKRFYSHVFKSKESAIRELYVIPDNESVTDKEIRIANTIKEYNKSIDYNLLKNQSLYTSLISNEFLKPSNFISDEICSKRINQAKERYDQISTELKFIFTYLVPNDNKY